MAAKKQVKGPVAQLVRAVGKPGPNVQWTFAARQTGRQDAFPGQRTMHMYRMYGIRATQEQLPRTAL